MITILCVLVLIFFLLLAAMVIIPVFFGAPWHPLSDENIDRIIKFADLQPGETFYDLGSGDGRVLIAATREKCVQGVGVEIDPIKVWLSKYFTITAELTDRVCIYRGNMYDFDVSKPEQEDWFSFKISARLAPGESQQDILVILQKLSGVINFK